MKMHFLKQMWFSLEETGAGGKPSTWFPPGRLVELKTWLENIFVVKKWKTFRKCIFSIFIKTHTWWDFERGLDYKLYQSNPVHLQHLTFPEKISELKMSSNEFSTFSKCTLDFHKLVTGGEPSTCFPPEGLVELQNRCRCHFSKKNDFFGKCHFSTFSQNSHAVRFRACL